MKVWYIFIVFIIGCVCADDQAFTVDAKVMEFDAQTQLLKAQDVVITFKNGAKLMSHRAHLDFESLAGVMSSGEDGELVVYSGMMTREDETPRPLIVKGRVMMVDVEGKEIEVVAEKDVEIIYDRDFTAYGERAVFRNEQVDDYSFSSLTKNGTLQMECENSEHLCRVEHKNGDVMEADKINFFPFENRIDGWSVRGSITSIGQLKEVLIRSDHICWLPKDQVIRLEGKSQILDEEVGTLTTEGTLEIKREGPSEKSPIKEVVSRGRLRFDQFDGEFSFGGYGKMVLDCQKKRLVVTSPKDENGLTSSSHQAFYEDLIGIIYADQFEIDYELDQQQVKPLNVLIKGHVRMQNQFIPDSKVRDVLEQYALADQVQYSPVTKEMSLKAKKGKRVLYYDKSKGIQVSAPGILVTRDLNNEIQVHGRGNVRMKFTQNEVNELQKYFPFLQ